MATHDALAPSSTHRMTCVATLSPCSLPCSPIDAFRTLRAHGKSCALLHGSPGCGTAGRFSILALDPCGNVSVHPDDPRDPFVFLQTHLNKSFVNTSESEALRIPFAGGWVGYISYDILHRVERIKKRARLAHDFPLLQFTLYRSALVFDRLQNTWTAAGWRDETETADALRERLQHALALLKAPPPPRLPGTALAGTPTSNFTRTTYEAAVRTALDYIAAGDIYQVNLSQRFEGIRAVPVEELAVRLLEANPAPFGACLIDGDRAICSTSPERFLRLNERVVETWPIKGTRPRSADPKEDARLLRELEQSEKEKAELVMITDLLRNDLGRVCDYGSVRVRVARVLESFAHVHHTHSEIEGRLRDGIDIPALLRATLPGGSVTGAPKVRACDIIEELEPTARGPYCGVLGYISIDGRMDMNIAIRTVLVEGDSVSFQVGGGIVADSDPAAEYEETLHKAKGILDGLGAPLPEISGSLASDGG